MEINFSGYQTVVYEGDQGRKQRKEEIAKYQTQKDSVTRQTKQHNTVLYIAQMKSLNDKIKTLKHDLDIYNKNKAMIDNPNKITLFTSEAYNFEHESIMLDPKEVSAIVMTNEGFKKIYKFIDTSELEVPYETIPFTIGSVYNKTNKYYISCHTLSGEVKKINGSKQTIKENIIDIIYIYELNKVSYPPLINYIYDLKNDYSPLKNTNYGIVGIK